MSERGRIFQLALLAVVVFATLGVRGEEAVRVEERMPSNVDQRLNKVERLLESQGLLDMLSQLESLQKEMQRLRGEIEVQTHTLEQIKQRQRDLYVDLDKRLQRTEALGVAGTTPSPPGPST
ncbi:MAG: YbgF trimerization domain-containing protein, partial [Gammaproteobacteria bacterium]